MERLGLRQRERFPENITATHSAAHRQKGSTSRTRRPGKKSTAFPSETRPDFSRHKHLFLPEVLRTPSRQHAMTDMLWVVFFFRHITGERSQRKTSVCRKKIPYNLQRYCRMFEIDSGEPICCFRER